MSRLPRRGVVVDQNTELENKKLGKYLSPLSVWALSFGCAVGWGSFVMPGTTFLPAAGPLGTALGIGLGAVVMMIIGMNYHYLMNRYPQAGGTLTYAIRTFGHDHGYLASWFLLLVYVAIIWANATAFALIGRYLFGTMFQFGFHYNFLGYDVYFGEVLLTLFAIVIVGCVCMFGKRLAVGLQVLLALVLFAGIVTCAAVLFSCNMDDGVGYAPAFAKRDAIPLRQIIRIIALSPWAYAGFESVSNSVEGFKFNIKKTFAVLFVALLTSAAAYILLNQIAITEIPAGYASWTEYISEIGSFSGLKGLPTFYAVNSVMGKAGLVILGFTAAAGILTGLIGNYIAGSRLIYAMADEGIFSKWFMRLNKGGSPKNALLFLILISLPIPFFGRTAIGWIVDVNTIGATVAYGYTSAAALVNAKRDKNKLVTACGVIGLIMSVVFFFYFMSWSAHAMATESYLILAFWSILGFVYFRHVFAKDKKHHFGKSTVVWIGLLFVIFFTTLMWVKQATDDMTKKIVTNISEYHVENHSDITDEELEKTEVFLDDQLSSANRTMTRNSVIQMLIIVASLGIMFSIYTLMSKREKQAEAERHKAEESNKAKSIFLSNMSHDIRTPMNAIIGYVNLASEEDTDLPTVREYLSKIKTSSRHLLALINDVLEMSRIESGKMDLEPIAVDLKKSMDELKDMFSTQMIEKSIDYTVTCDKVTNPCVYCDKNRLNRVLLNLISNAYKFTPEGGKITVRLEEKEHDKEGYGSYLLSVKDSGIGMTPEFAAKVFEAFERERTSTVSKIEGTGLGMAITKGIVDLMGGTIKVNTEPEKGTEFVISLHLPIVEEIPEEEEREETSLQPENEIFRGMHLLLVEDMEINREIALMLLTRFGFTADTATNGREAVDKIAASKPGQYQCILMDIQMPVMDGYEASRAIRALDNKELAEIPIVAMTANAFSEDVKKAREAGMNAHIAKPIDVNVLVNTLSDILI